MAVHEAANQQDPLPTLLTMQATCPCTSKTLVLNVDGNKALLDESEMLKLQREKSLAANLAMKQKMCQGQWAETIVSPQAFQPKTKSLQRWSAASKIKSILAFRLKSKRTDVRTYNLETCEPTACKPGQQGSSASDCHKWQDEPNPPDFQQLEALMQLKAILLEQHGSMAQAFKHIAKSSGRDGSITKRDLRMALHLMSSKNLATAPLPDADQVFTALLALFRRSEGEICNADFLRFPEMLEREKALRLQLMSPISVDGNELLLGAKLAQRLASGVESPAAANDLLQKLAVALELEPRRTTNLLMERGPISSGPLGGVKAGLEYIVGLTDEFGAPKAGARLTSLIAGWALCGAFTRQAVALGAVPRPTGKDSQPSEPAKSRGSAPSSMMRVKKAVATKMKKSAKSEKPQQSMPASNGEDSHENACHNALWEALPPGKILWTVAHGAEQLNDDDFEQLLKAAWAIFDNFNAVDWVLGPVGLTRLRPKLDELAALRLRHCALSKDLDNARAQLGSSHMLLQQVASMCAADPRLASTAALYGVPFLAERARCCANASVNLVADEADASQGRATAAAAAQLNRVAAKLAADLMPHVEEMLGGRKFEVKVSHPASKHNPLAEWHCEVTREANDNIDRLLSMGEVEYRWGKILSDPTLLAVEKGSSDDIDFSKVTSAP